MSRRLSATWRRRSISRVRSATLCSKVRLYPANCLFSSRSRCSLWRNASSARLRSIMPASVCATARKNSSS